MLAIFYLVAPELVSEALKRTMVCISWAISRTSFRARGSFVLVLVLALVPDRNSEQQAEEALGCWATTTPERAPIGTMNRHALLPLSLSHPLPLRRLHEREEVKEDEDEAFG
jgi:hypothetical protein